MPQCKEPGSPRVLHCQTRRAQSFLHSAPPHTATPHNMHAHNTARRRTCFQLLLQLLGLLLLQALLHHRGRPLHLRPAGSVLSRWCCGSGNPRARGWHRCPCIQHRPGPPPPPPQQQSAERRADRRPFWECARAAAGRALRAHQLLGLLEPQVGDAADLLDDLDLGGRVKAVQLEVKLRLLLLLLLRGSRCCRAAWRGWWAGGCVCVCVLTAVLAGLPRCRHCSQPLLQVQAGGAALRHAPHTYTAPSPAGAAAAMGMPIGIPIGMPAKGEAWIPSFFRRMSVRSLTSRRLSCGRERARGVSGAAPPPAMSDMWVVMGTARQPGRCRPSPHCPSPSSTNHQAARRAPAAGPAHLEDLLCQLHGLGIGEGIAGLRVLPAAVVPLLQLPHKALRLRCQAPHRLHRLPARRETLPQHVGYVQLLELGRRS